MSASAPQFDRWLTASELGALGRALEDPPAVRDFRRAAFEAYSELLVEPNPLYRGYANLSGADLTGLDLGAPGAAVALPPAPEATLRIVHDAAGTHVAFPPALRDAGVTVRTLPELWRETAPDGSLPRAPPRDKLQALALSTINRIVHVDVPDRCTMPVRVQDLTVLSRAHEGLSVYRRLRAGRSARVLYTEEVYAAPEDAEGSQRLASSIVEGSVAEDAALHYLTVHAPDHRTLGLYRRYGSVGTQGRLAWMWAGLGGYRTRASNLSELVGSGSRLEDFQTFYGEGEQAYDSSVEIRHVGTDTHGQSITRGLFKDRARGVSRGLVRIEKDARKTLSYLSEHAMLLSRGASSETIPVLEILCRDVKATHSSSVAPVDPEKVFYLRSRGIPESESVRMIGEGFLAHVLERAPIAELRDRLYPLLAARWEGRPIAWSAPDFPALPPLSVSAESAGDEWRFDAKLR
jgi:Fe-S cluster assembly scaffold protein SufB